MAKDSTEHLVENDEKGRENTETLTKPQLRSSIFPNVAPFINFLRPNQKYENFVRLEIPWNLWTACHNPILIRCMVRAGFKATQISDPAYSKMTGAIWDSIDSKTRFFMLCKLTNSPAKATQLLSESAKYQDLMNMNAEVKINRLPGALCICRKDELAKRHAKFMKLFGPEEFNFVPETFSIPSERDEAIERIVGSQIENGANMREIGGEEQKNLWIVKPCIQSGGEGIQVIDNMFDIPTVNEKLKGIDQAIVQKYIKDPFLIRGHKFDMRLYVLVTSVDPLLIYLYKDGLARFATEPYNTDSINIKNNCIHLTNSKVNKTNIDSYGDSNEDPYSGFLWTLSMLKNYLKEEGIEWIPLWSKLKDVVRKTILLGYKTMRQECSELDSRYNCYKLLGFDIMLDENLKPWVLEVNTDPWLFADPIDIDLKSAMIAEMFNIVGFHIPQDIAAKKKAELTQLYPNVESFCQDPRIYRKEKLAQLATGNAENIELLNLSQINSAQLKILMKAEEELSQTNNFARIFPTCYTNKYTRYLGDGADADFLLHAWEHKKQIDENALEILQYQCEKKIHEN